MAIRRVVAGNLAGKSRVIDDSAGISNAFDHVQGFDPALLWKTESGQAFSAAYAPRSGDNVLPEPGGTSLMIVTFPPDRNMVELADPAAAGAEYMQKVPGLAETFEQENPGMHKTPTTDYAIVLEGEVVCMLDEGEVTVRAGDVMIQDHTRHGWSNRTDAPAKVAFILIG
jgi:mannose-6-phosphate isomerase-like protein (cupin superfamily)